MNGFTIMADSYRKMVEIGKIDNETANKEIRIFEFLSSCDTEDLCRLVDSSAFNAILNAYLEMAVNETDLDDKSKSQILNKLTNILDEIPAEKALINNYMQYKHRL